MQSKRLRQRLAREADMKEFSVRIFFEPKDLLIYQKTPKHFFDAGTYSKLRHLWLSFQQFCTNCSNLKLLRKILSDSLHFFIFSAAKAKLMISIKRRRREKSLQLAFYRFCRGKNECNIPSQIIIMNIICYYRTHYRIFYCNDFFPSCPRPHIFPPV